MRCVVCRGEGQLPVAAFIPRLEPLKESRSGVHPCIVGGARADANLGHVINGGWCPKGDNSHREGSTGRAPLVEGSVSEASKGWHGREDAAPNADDRHYGVFKARCEVRNPYASRLPASACQGHTGRDQSGAALTKEKGEPGPVHVK